MIHYIYRDGWTPLDRGSCKPFADSLGFKPYQFKESIGLKGEKVIVEVFGRDSMDELGITESLVNNNNVVLRIVDYHDFYFKGEEGHKWYELIKKYNLKIVSPVVQRILIYDTIHIPYHYNEDDEVSMDDYFHRAKRMTLTGARSASIYPMREVYYQSNNPLVFTIPHPGYEGNNTDIYRRELSNSTHMVVSTSYNQYELLKYVECAEFGCCPVGDYPKNLRDMDPGLFEIDFSLPTELYVSDSYEKAVNYRNWFKINRSKKSILKQYKQLFNYEKRSNRLFYSIKY